MNQAGTPPKLIGKLPNLDDSTVDRALKFFESSIVKAKVENAVIITVKGEIYHCTGDLEGVPSPFFEQLGEKLNNAVVTHNHPIGSSNEYSFSAKDRRLFSDFKLAKLRGIDEKFIYEFDRNSKTVDDIPDTSKPVEYAFVHCKNISFAKSNGIGYRRWTR